MDSVIGDRAVESELGPVEEVRRLVGLFCIFGLIGWAVVARLLDRMPVEYAVPYFWHYDIVFPFLLPRVFGLALVALFWAVTLRRERDDDYSSDDAGSLGFLVLAWLLLAVVAGIFQAMSWFGHWLTVAAIITGAFYHSKVERPYDTFGRECIVMYGLAIASVVGLWAGLQTGIAAGLLFVIMVLIWSFGRVVFTGLLELNNLAHHTP